MYKIHADHQFNFNHKAFAHFKHSFIELPLNTMYICIMRRCTRSTRSTSPTTDILHINRHIMTQTARQKINSPTSSDYR